MFYLEDDIEYDEDYSTGPIPSSYEECPNSLYYYNKYPDEYDQLTEGETNGALGDALTDTCDSS